MKTKHILMAFLAAVVITSANAQQSANGHFYGEDAFRFSNWGLTGSARMQGLGGSYTALGADATSASSNPAGLGFYNRSEVSITPFYNSNSTNTTYQSSVANVKSSNVSIGQAALIFRFEGIGTRRKSSAFAITYSKQAYLPTQFNYVGTKAKSSLQDYFAEQATARGVNGTTLDNEFDAKSGLAFTPTALAYEAFLIDPTSNGATTYQRVESTLPTKQSGTYTSSGSVSQTNLAYGVNFDDKTYFGLGVGIARVAYENNTSHREDFTNGSVFNNFTFSDQLSTSGTGINFSLGGIFKVAPTFQLGASFISPTWYSMSEDYGSNISINVKPNTINTSFTSVSLAPSESPFEYNITTPLRANLGAALFFNNKQGLISADAEYVGYSMMKVKDPYENDANTTSYPGFTSDQRRAIQNTFNDVVNFKVGAEYRIDVIRLRAGVNYRPDPYKKGIDGLNHSQTLVSAGAGYRSSKFFLDVAGVYGQTTTGFTPYELANGQNYASAQVKTTATNFVISIGTFF